MAKYSERKENPFVELTLDDLLLFSNPFYVNGLLPQVKRAARSLKIKASTLKEFAKVAVDPRIELREKKNILDMILEGQELTVDSDKKDRIL